MSEIWFTLCLWGAEMGLKNNWKMSKTLGAVVIRLRPIGICTAATNELVFLAYLVAIPRDCFR